MRWFCVIGIVAASSLWLGCGDDDNPSSAGGGQTPESSLPVTSQVFSGAYTQTDDDTLTVTIPERMTCDGNAQVLQPESASSIYYRIEDNEISVSLADAYALIAAVAEGAESLVFMDSLFLALDSSSFADFITPVAVFERTEEGEGLEGTWFYSDLGPELLKLSLSEMLDSAALEGIEAMQGDSAGNAVVFFRFDDGQVDGLMNRQALGEVALESAVDTALYNVQTASVDDSTWLLVGGVTNDSVTVVVDANGNITYTHDEPASYAEHTFYRQPEQCPNPTLPEWFPLFLASNER